MKTSTQSRKRISADAALALWREYKETGDAQVRNRLVMTYAPLVKYIVFKKVRELPARCEVEDFISCGLEALIASIDRYDPEQGRHARAVRLDADPRRRARRAAPPGLGAALAAPLGARHPQGARAVHRAARPPPDARRARRDARHHASRSCAAARTTSPCPTSRRSTRSSSPTTRRPSSASTRSPRPTRGSIPSSAAAASAAKENFRRAFDTLPQREREVAVLLYVKNLTLREIGDILGVSESRVCQIHSQLKRTLRAQLSEDAQLFAAVA